MSKRVPSTVIRDILNCIERLQLYTKNLSFEDFTSNFMVIEACLYNIQVIGEAVRQLDDDVKTSEHQIPWILIKGMRNRLIHEYFGTDLSIVWNVVTNELPTFKIQLEEIYRKLLQQGR